MTFVRTHRTFVACTLTGLVLFSALLCSLGHGRMLAAFMPAPWLEICGDTPAATLAVQRHAEAGHPAVPGSHGLIMQLAQFDCAFAGKLGTALVSFAAMGWLLRRLLRRLPLHERLDRSPSRHTSPGRVAQAP
ncbi:hypothetical protein IFR09_27090 [Pseudomonas syringae]|nr:hypothetical protein [Pseudomonas syringae]MBD8573869.1 hypothetical protein [Pseudomonas syringae]MBD8790165.1 hypothetical protein [Pseudomonas syringae]MBD8803833.1 hypothetical protein [Pseudomonas syringae]MBD8814834.1 hypothetical protein [Pseudomonas syringae]